MKHFYFAVFLTLFPVLMMAQEDGVEQEVRNYQESQSQLIAKGRRLLMDKFLEGDLEKVKEVKDYLLREVENEDYAALYPGEKWMIMYWTGEYELLQESVLGFNQDSINAYQRKILPQQDLLYIKLLERSWQELLMLEYNIDRSELDQQAKDFLLLHLNFMVSGEPLNQLSQEEVNRMADLYLETHPGSSYETHIRNNIRYKYAPSKFGLAFEFFTGYGMFTGELSEMFNNQGVMGISFDVEYQKFTLYLRNYISFGKTNQEQEENGVVWKKGSQANTFLPEASIGYAVVDNDKLRLSPFAGFGGANISPVTVDIDENPDLEDLEIGFSPAYTIGLNLNLKLGWETTPLLSQREDKSYWFVRVRYGYTMPLFNDHPMYNGNIHQITIGFGGMYRGMKRAL